MNADTLGQVAKYTGASGLSIFGFFFLLGKIFESSILNTITNEYALLFLITVILLSFIVCVISVKTYDRKKEGKESSTPIINQDSLQKQSPNIVHVGKGNIKIEMKNHEK